MALQPRGANRQPWIPRWQAPWAFDGTDEPRWTPIRNQKMVLTSACICVHLWLKKPLLRHFQAILRAFVSSWFNPERSQLQKSVPIAGKRIGFYFIFSASIGFTCVPSNVIACMSFSCGNVATFI